MNRDALASMTGRWLHLLPALVLYDPIFRYAAIAFAVALLLFVGRTAQEWAGSGPIPSSANPPPAQHAEPPAPAPGPRPGLGASPSPAAPTTIAPSRALDGIKVAPAPADSFGRLPAHEQQP